MNEQRKSELRGRASSNAHRVKSTLRNKDPDYVDHKLISSDAKDGRNVAVEQLTQNEVRVVEAMKNEHVL